MASPCVFCKKTHEFGREEALELLRKTPDSMRLLLDTVNPQAFQMKPETAWSPREIMIHLVDTEIAFGFRMRFIMAEKNPVITPFDGDDWVATFTYKDLDATQLIRAFTPIRRVNLEMLQGVDPALFDKPAEHLEFGTITVGLMIPHIAAHDLTHLQQIRDRLFAV